LFDVVHRDGFDVSPLALRTRKAILLDLMEWHDPLRFTSHRNTDGEAYFREACRRGWEGVIAKDAKRPYRAGRSPDWLKFKCSQGQEFVVGGFTAPKGTRKGLGALLLGYNDRSGLRFAGKVGTGFDTAMLHRLRHLLDPALRATSPFVDPVREPTASWVEPSLVVQVDFSEWTGEGRLRHPRFTGIRDDKAPAEVVREVPA
jgi:ATP-dependent DNA ligase